MVGDEWSDSEDGDKVARCSSSDAAYVSRVFYIDGAQTITVVGVAAGETISLYWATRTMNRRMRKGQLVHTLRYLCVLECARCGFLARPPMNDGVVRGSMKKQGQNVSKKRSTLASLYPALGELIATSSAISEAPYAGHPDL